MMENTVSKCIGGNSGYTRMNSGVERRGPRTRGGKVSQERKYPLDELNSISNEGHSSLLEKFTISPIRYHIIQTMLLREGRQLFHQTIFRMFQLRMRILHWWSKLLLQSTQQKLWEIVLPGKEIQWTPQLHLDLFLQHNKLLLNYLPKWMLFKCSQTIKRQQIRLPKTKVKGPSGLR